MIYPPGNDHISPPKECVKLIFPFGGICGRSLEGSMCLHFCPRVYQNNHEQKRATLEKEVVTIDYWCHSLNLYTTVSDTPKYFPKLIIVWVVPRTPVTMANEGFLSGFPNSNVFILVVTWQGAIPFIVLFFGLFSGLCLDGLNFWDRSQMKWRVKPQRLSPSSDFVRRTCMWNKGQFPKPKEWPRWWFQTFFIFIPIWGNDPIWRAYFSNGLKPPPRWHIKVNDAFAIIFQRILLWARRIGRDRCPQPFGVVRWSHWMLWGEPWGKSWPQKVAETSGVKHRPQGKESQKFPGFH